MTALQDFKNHMADCDYCRDNKENLCPEGQALQYAVYVESATSPNTVRGNETKRIINEIIVNPRISVVDTGLCTCFLCMSRRN